MISLYLSTFNNGVSMRSKRFRGVFCFRILNSCEMRRFSFFRSRSNFHAVKPSKSAQITETLAAQAIMVSVRFIFATYLATIPIFIIIILEINLIFTWPNNFKVKFRFGYNFQLVFEKSVDLKYL